MNRFIQVITEIEEQKAALQSIIDDKRAEIEALQVEIPQLEAQLAGMTQLFTDAQLLQATQQQQGANSTKITYTSSTPVNVRTFT